MIFSQNEIPPAPRDARVPRELMIEYVASTFIVVMKWWLDRRFSLSPREIDAIFRRLVTTAGS